MRCGPCYLSMCLLTVLMGCGSSGPRLYDVSGTVTWNEQPLPEGDIIFYAADGQTAPQAGKIVDGKFRFKATAGVKRVEITAVRVVPDRIDPATKLPARESYLPEHYNTKTTLTETVRTDGENQFTFPLTAKASR